MGTYDKIDAVNTSVKKVHERFQEAHLQCLDRRSNTQVIKTFAENFKNCKNERFVRKYCNC